MKKLILLILLPVLISSCSNKIIFTSDIQKKLIEKDLDIKKVQFYNSDKIILTRIVPHNAARVADGEIRFENGQYVEEIIIKKETPGICRSVNNIELGISFEQGQNKVVNFRLNKVTNYYVIDVERHASNTLKLVYDSLIFMIQPESEKAKLLVRKNDKYIYQINQRIAEGVTIQ